ncbi:MAG: protein translocase subunit SecF [Micrococcales bacterium]
MSKFNDFGNALYSGERSINFIGRRKLWYTIASALILISVSVTALRGGFNFGIEFRGGSEFKVTGTTSQQEALAAPAVQKVIGANTQVNVTSIGTDSIRIQTEKLDANESEAVRKELAVAYGVESAAVSSSFIGANWGSDVTAKAVNGLVVFIILAAITMALYFRTMKMSVAALVSLLHDLILTSAVYGALGFEVTPAAVIGFLTILGYSLYDTVVVFDKIRENTKDVEHSDTVTFAEQVNLAVNQTLVRSINTSIVAVLPVGAILFIGSYLFGAGTLRDISLALFAGIIVGTFSTIFIAAPLYSQLREREMKFAKAADKVLASR